MAFCFVLGFFFDKHDDVFKNLKTTKNFDYILIINILYMLCRCFSVCTMKKANGIANTYTCMIIDIGLKCEFQKIWKTDTN